MTHFNIGMIGCGTVGGGFLEAFGRNRDLLTSRLGVKLDIVKIAVKEPLRDPTRIKIPASLLTHDWRSVVNDPRTHIITELIGGIEDARLVVLSALKLGKPVITANKKLLAVHGPELFKAAKKHRANLYYEASVGGGIPIIKVLREGLVGNRITRIHGIVNGTCNYVLTRMKNGVDQETALKEAKDRGIAEANASSDIDGEDAAHKIAILASLAHGYWLDHQRVDSESIRIVERDDIQFAAKLGYTIRQISTVKKIPYAPEQPSGQSCSLQLSVHPTLVPNSHVLASINDEFNAIYVHGDVVLDTLYYGLGAGPKATASAVLSDVADAALDLKCKPKIRLQPFTSFAKTTSVIPAEEIVSSYYLRLSVIDEPGALAKIASVFDNTKIGIASINQPEGAKRLTTPVVFLTHEASYGLMKRALAEIGRLAVVTAPPVTIRVEHFRDDRFNHLEKVSVSRPLAHQLSPSKAEPH